MGKIEKEKETLQATVIISTYNAEAWLEKVLWGYAEQTVMNFEILIADDGSTVNTKELIGRMQNKMLLPIKHIWHDDLGFRKTEILNKAILAAGTAYLIFTDGDCIPRKDFVETHLNYRKKGHFLSGGYFKLPMAISQQITQDDVHHQRCFDLSWLTKNGLPYSIKNWKLTKSPFIATLLNKLTPTAASWNGHNASAYLEDILAVNGFNTQMQYGGEDREFGERLVNLGLQSIQVRYHAIVVHLDHARGYVREEMWKKNQAIRATTKKYKVVKTPTGIDEL